MYGKASWVFDGAGLDTGDGTRLGRCLKVAKAVRILDMSALYYNSTMMRNH